MLSTRHVDQIQYISPEKQVNAGLWTLCAGATLFLGLRIWCKVMRRTGLWYDDYMLVVSWIVLLTTNIFISLEYATGYSTGYWDDRMHILINISSCGTLIGASLSKTAFGITLLRMSNRVQTVILWTCILSMNLFMIVKVFFQWAKYCGKSDYQNWYRLQGPCIDYGFEESFKVAGNTDNIIMDFIFACFPWWITWRLEMRRVEKIALCITMSLGMLIAITSAIRTKWIYRPIMHQHDEYYIWRNGISAIWYSSEVAGTIIVQCIPILRPFLRDIHTSFTSSKLGDSEDGYGKSSWRDTLTDIDRRISRATSRTSGSGRGSFGAAIGGGNLCGSSGGGSGIGANRGSGGNWREDKGRIEVEIIPIPLSIIPEEKKGGSIREGDDCFHFGSGIDVEAGYNPNKSWRFPNMEFETPDFGEREREVEIKSPRSGNGSGGESEAKSPRSDYWDYEEEEERVNRQNGLSPPPPRAVRGVSWS